LLEKAHRLQLHLAYESVQSDNLEFRLALTTSAALRVR
jgi:hypothetical protein